MHQHKLLGVEVVIIRLQYKDYLHCVNRPNTLVYLLTETYTSTTQITINICTMIDLELIQDKLPYTAMEPARTVI